MNDVAQVFPFLEHYAGEAVMSNAVRTKHACPVASLDIKYAPSMDVTTPSGFAIGAQWFGEHGCNLNLYEGTQGEVLINSILALCSPRLHLLSVLKGAKEGFTLWQAMQCSTWVSIARGSTMRSYLNPLGLESLDCVAKGNTMLSRTDLSVYPEKPLKLRPQTVASQPSKLTCPYL